MEGIIRLKTDEHTFKAKTDTLCRIFAAWQERDNLIEQTLSWLTVREKVKKIIAQSKPTTGLTGAT